jgi:outer membrane protein assembly factor BamB
MGSDEGCALISVRRFASFRRVGHDPDLRPSAAREVRLGIAAWARCDEGDMGERRRAYDPITWAAWTFSQYCMLYRLTISSRKAPQIDAASDTVGLLSCDRPRGSDSFMSRFRSRTTWRRHPRRVIATLGSLVVACSLTGLGVVTTAGPASAYPASDPLASVTYQENPAHDGSYTDSTFTGPLRRAWSVDLGGDPNNSYVGYPVIAKGLVFVSLSLRDASSDDDIEALSLATGEVVWGPTAINGTYGVANLAYDEDQLFAVTYDGQVTAFAASTGNPAWVTQLPEQYKYQYAFDQVPTATAGTVYVGGSGGSSGKVFALDEATGDMQWSSNILNGANNSTAVGDGGVFVADACDEAYRFDLTGKVVWHQGNFCQGAGSRTPVLHGGHLYVRESGAYASATLDEATGTQVGSFESDSAPAFADGYMATMVGAGGSPYRGTLTVVDASTGTQVWQSPTADDVTAPVFANGEVIEGRVDGTVEVRDESDGALVWSGPAAAPILTFDEYNVRNVVGLAVGDGTLVVPGGNTLTAFVPASDPYVTVTQGPPQHAVVGASTSFSFDSNVSNANFECTLDGSTSPCTSPVAHAHLTQGSHSFWVSIAGTSARTATQVFIVDAEPPTVRLHRFEPMITRRSTATVTWSASDPSGTPAYQLRLRRAAIGVPLPPWTTRPITSKTTASPFVPAGGRLCVAVRAEDGVGNWSTWTPAQCVARTRKLN